MGLEKAKHDKKEAAFGLSIKGGADLAEGSAGIRSVLVRLSPATR